MKAITEKFVKGLRESDTWAYYNMFSIMESSNPDFLEEIISNYKEYPDDWFRLFHKSLRQVDFFQDCAVIEPVITEKERKLRSEALNYCMQHRRLNGKLVLEDGSLYDDWDRNDPGYLKYQELLPKLNRKLRTYDIKMDICGHLDSLLYELISEDNKGLLYNYMSKFFKNEL